MRWKLKHVLRACPLCGNCLWGDKAIGGSDVRAGVLTWTLALILNDPQILYKAEEKLHLQVGKKRQVDEYSHKKSRISSSHCQRIPLALSSLSLFRTLESYG
ncbi:hypothetical protein SLA2020_207690 [Shorea laevis]